MQVKVLGAARQVGRSAFLLTHNDSKIFLDYGALTTKVPGFPMHVPPKDVKAVVLSHAHLDHSGAAPLQFLGGRMKLHATPVTSELSDLLIKDFIKISGQYLPFEFLDLMAMNSHTVNHGYHEPFEIGDFTVTFYDAGHIPGSAIIAVEAGSKRLVYTGDINGEETNLLSPSSKDLGEADMVITESTYATADHPARKRVEEDFADFASMIVERGGILLVPAFSVGRAQEIAMTLKKYDFKHPVAMDGMALKVNAILLRYQEYLRDPVALRRTLEGLEEVASWSQRNALVKKPGVIISPAGMLVGGASIFYNERLAMDPKNGIAIVSFQVPGTPGRTLIEKGLTIYKGKPTKVVAEVKRFDFSSHSGRQELMGDLKGVKGSPTYLTVHGEEESCVSLAEQIHRELGADAFAASPGQEFQV
ncbi:MAG TPA: MBL fold metallo-hydrolase [Nitrososphaerales archaeon]|nr:MBL fold metallo-hydrolase [Nitrososphaerales archaeon]